MFTTTLEWQSFTERKPEEGCLLLISELSDPWGDLSLRSVNIRPMLYWYEKEANGISQFRGSDKVCNEHLDRLYWAYLNWMPESGVMPQEQEHAEVQNN